MAVEQDLEMVVQVLLAAVALAVIERPCQKELVAASLLKVESQYQSLLTQ